VNEILTRQKAEGKAVVGHQADAPLQPFGQPWLPPVQAVIAKYG
jgi:hypothetical protein